ncbi:MAG: LPS assembly lipoprotein LptE [Lishizhenia sp.]
MRFLLLIGFVFLIQSCWPTSIAFKDGSIPENWKFFFVDLLENNAPNAPINYGPQLTEELKDAIQNRTGVKLAPSAESKSDFTLSGIINNYAVSPVAITQNDNAAKNRLTVAIQFDLFIAATDEKEEELITFNVSRFTDYDADQDLGAVQNELFLDINDQIIQDVLNKLTSNW